MSKRIVYTNKDKLVFLYISGLSAKDLAEIFPYKRTTIKELMKREGVLRTQSDASILAIKSGKKSKAIKRLIEVAKTTNRFNPLKTPLKGSKHHRWVKDRTKLKSKRASVEEMSFIKQLLVERDFTCELTGVRGGSLSVHHIKPVRTNPELLLDKSNVIVIRRDIHKHFHKLFSTKSTEKQWKKYVTNKLYLQL